MNKKITLIDWGLKDYKEAWEEQEKLFQSTIDLKVANKNLPSPIETPNYLIFVEHPHVLTLGKSGVMEHLLMSEEFLKEKHISFYKVNRGGDITYHGLGQVVGYPILDLDNFSPDIHQYLRSLEEVIILTLDRSRYPACSQDMRHGGKSFSLGDHAWLCPECRYRPKLLQLYCPLWYCR